MAHLKSVSGGPNDEAFTYYFNDTSVGAGGTNRKRSDVQLVQFFLRQFYLAHPDIFKKLKIPGTSVGIDGKVGRQTIDAIRTFQYALNSNGFLTVVDGRVNVAPHTHIGDTAYIYTIARLNDWFFSPDYRPENKVWMGNLRNHPDIVANAPELQAELAQLETATDSDGNA